MRAFKIAITVGSSVLLLLVTSFYVYAMIRRPEPLNQPRIPLVANFNMSMTDLRGGQVMFYNYTRPYAGSMLGEAHIVHGWSGFGIYYRQIKFDTPVQDWFTFTISVWYLIGVCSVLPVVAIVSKMRSRAPTMDGDPMAEDKSKAN